MYRICVILPTGFSYTCPDLSTWVFRWAYHLHLDQDIAGLDWFQVKNCRIDLMRNMGVAHARATKATHILWIDPDMVLDKYLGKTASGEPVANSRFKPFWQTAWKFIKEHPMSIAAAPYCGCYPLRPWHVFTKNESDRLVRVDHETARNLRGWTAVEAVGTGAMLMDARIFDRLEQPYFRDSYQDETHTKLRLTQDVDFCLRCRGKGVGIYVNWDTPAGHWQNSVVDPPYLEEIEHYEAPVPLANDPSVPVLTMEGGGDKAWT